MIRMVFMVSCALLLAVVLAACSTTKVFMFDKDRCKDLVDGSRVICESEEY